MQRRRRAAVIAASGGALALAVIGASAAAGQPAGTTPLYHLATGAQAAESGARITRTDSGIAFSIRTTGLAPRHADTVWVMVFNHPEHCRYSPRPGFRCGIGDLGVVPGVEADPRVEPSVLYGAGNVVGSAGRAGFGGHLTRNDTDGALFGPGVTRPRDAEIQFRIRDHGRAIPGLVDEQTHTFNGGCEPGQPNEGQCEDVQTTGA